MWFLIFMKWALLYAFYGTIVLVLASKRWPETFLKERVSEPDATFMDADAASRFWAFAFWIPVLAFYILTRIYDLLTWLYSLCVLTNKKDLIKEEVKPTLESKVEQELRQRYAAEQELNVNKQGV